MIIMYVYTYNNRRVFRMNTLWIQSGVQIALIEQVMHAVHHIHYVHMYMMQAKTRICF